LAPQLVLIAPAVTHRDGLFRLFGETLAAAGVVEAADDVVSRLAEREAILSTGIGRGVAVPHAQIPGLGRVVMAASVHPVGLDYPALDAAPVRLVFCLLGDASTTADHLAGLARLARLARSDEAREMLVAASDGDQFVRVLRRLEGV
jgi:mannitol/fructose-specific phosphotransferase system IIA component (Ntr-type)